VLCPQCHFDNRASVTFCEECGARFDVACPSCGAAVPPGRKFCGTCGKPLTAHPAPAAKFASPETYTPKHLIEKILTSKAALEGERKQVTVLFADLKGSMELLADRDPEEARKLLDPVLERMMEAVHRYEGTVNQVMGDGIMALFGAPLAHEDHAVRACYAALRMQESVKRYAEDAFRRCGVPVEIRVGLNSGEVVVRAIGSDLHMDYTAVGQTTHLAARMEQMATPGTILLSPDTLVLAEGFVQVLSRGPVPVKGLAARIEVFELTGASPARSRLQAAAARGLTRFVGRDAEIDVLRYALEQAGGGQGQVVAVLGEPGVGKSRLVWEFTHSHHSQGWQVLEAAAVSYGKATTYFPVIGLLRSYFGIEPYDDNRKMGEKVIGKLLSLDRALEPTLPVFLSLLDTPVADHGWTSLDPAQRRRQTLEALKRLLLRESQVQPVLLVVEDLHWIDSETQAWLDLLVESVPTARLLLLVNYRPEYGHVWGSKTCYRQVRLDPLPAASTGELLRTLLGPGPDLADLERLLIERTQGNPFFLEESVRALAETRALTGERGAYRLAQPIHSLRLPPTAQAILAARIDRLAPEDKRLLQAAAVVGKDVPFALLEAVADEPEERLRQGLARLLAAEFLYEARLFPELEYTFKHALTHEVAYAGILQDRRRPLHGRIVEAIERLHADRLPEHTESLAHHAFRAERWDEAAAYALQTARRASERQAWGETRAAVEQGLAAVAHLSPDQAVLELTIDLRHVYHPALVSLGEPELLAANREALVECAERHGDRHRVVHAKINLANALWFNGEAARALPVIEEAAAVAEALQDVRRQITAGFDLGQIRGALGDHHGAIDALEGARGLLRGDLVGDQLERAFHPFGSIRRSLSESLAELGHFERALDVAAEAMRFAETIRQPSTLAQAAAATGMTLLTRGRLAEAIPSLERALEVVRQSAGLAMMYPGAAANVARAYARAGRTDRGLQLAVDAAERAPRTSRFRLSYVMLALAETYLCAGRTDDARIAARQAVGLAHQRGERSIEAHTLWLLAEVAAAAEPFNAADVRARYCASLNLATELGMRPLVAHCHLGLGKLGARTDKREQAREYLTTATTMYREMDMPFWLEQAEAELKGLA